jgi:hypothetical protein
MRFSHPRDETISFVMRVITCQSVMAVSKIGMRISHIWPWSMMRVLRCLARRTPGIAAYPEIARSGVANSIGARLVRRLSDVLAAQRQRQVDQEIAGLLARSGGRLTDSMEREMMEKALASDWSPSQ